MPRKTKKSKSKRSKARRGMSMAQIFGRAGGGGGTPGGGPGGALPIAKKTRKAAKKALKKRPKTVQRAAKKAARKQEKKAKRQGRTERQVAASARNFAKGKESKAAKTLQRATAEAAIATPGPARSGPRKGRKGSKKKGRRATAAAPGAWRKSKVTTTTQFARKGKRGIETKSETKSLVLNPKSMKNMDIVAYAGGVFTLAVAFVGAGVFHSYVVNRAPAGGKHTFIGKDATLRKMAKPTAVVYASTGGLGVVALAAAGFLRKRSPVVSGIVGGAAAGFFLYPIVLLLKYEVAGRLFGVKAGNEISFANTAFPDVQPNVLLSLQQLIDAQNADPATFIGQQESAPGFGDPSYAYGAFNGTPIPGVDGTGANGGIIVASPSNATGLIVRLLDPGLGVRKVNHAGAVRVSNAAGKAPAAANHAAGCGGNCGKPCCGGKKHEESEDELLAEAVEYERLANASSGADRDNYLAAAAKCKADARAKGKPQNQAARGPQPGDDQIRFGEYEYVRKDKVPQLPAPRRFANMNQAAGAPERQPELVPVKSEIEVATVTSLPPSPWKSHQGPKKAYVPRASLKGRGLPRTDFLRPHGRCSIPT